MVFKLLRIARGIKMELTKEELELQANREILKDVQEVLNKHAIKYMKTAPFMDLNKALDKLVAREQRSKLLIHTGAKA